MRAVLRTARTDANKLDDHLSILTYARVAVAPRRVSFRNPVPDTKSTPAVTNPRLQPAIGRRSPPPSARARIAAKCTHACQPSAFLVRDAGRKACRLRGTRRCRGRTRVND